jgi:hypothetical protein
LFLPQSLNPGLPSSLHSFHLIAIVYLAFEPISTSTMSGAGNKRIAGKKSGKAQLREEGLFGHNAFKVIL